MPDPVIQWKLNGTVIAAREVGDIVVHHQMMAVSQMSFRAAALFDSAPQFSYGDTVTLTKVIDGSSTTVFSGTCDPVRRIATPDTEGHDFFVSCPWLKLEETIYQEEWNVPGGGNVELPTAVLGMNSSGTEISVAAQIAAAAQYAGLSCSGGPPEILWPSKVKGLSCAEVIRTSLRFFPDYMCWINHATGNLQVVKRTAATVRTIDVGDEACESVSYRKREDLIPEGVKIIYTTQQIVDGEVFRAGAIDVAGEDSGPRVIVEEIPLAGTKMQFQKVPIQTRTLPDDQASAKAYLKERFPMLQNVTDTEWAITKWTKEVVPVSTEETTDHETLTVNPQAVRLPGTSLTDLPRELVRGSVADWMQVKVGKIHIDIGAKATSSATAATIEALRKLPSGFSVTATNAVTKIYKGLSQWESGENAPTGIADAIFDSMSGAYTYEGEVTLVEAECDAAAWMGTALNLTGTDDSGTAAMKANVTAATLDIAAGRTTIQFGPPAHLAPADFLELQRQIRLRPATWWSQEERQSDTLGHDVGPGSQGDTLMPYDVPEFVPDAPADTTPPFWPTLITEGEEGSETYKVIVTDGRVNERIPGEGDAVVIHKPGNIYAEGSSVALAEFEIADGQAVRVSVSVKEDGTIGLGEGAEEGATPVSIVVEAADAESVHYQPKVDDESSDGGAGEMKYTLAKLEGGALVYELAGSHIDHYQELPSILSTMAAGDGIGVIVKKWDNDARAYKFRVISKGLGQLNVTTNGDDVEVRGNMKSLDVMIVEGDTSVTEAEPDIKFTDGLTDTGTEVEDPEEPPEEIEKVIIPIPLVKQSEEEDQQIQVIRSDAPPGREAGYEYTVKGNGASGTLTVTVEGESPQTALEWEDGLVTTEEDVDIEIPAGGGFPGGGNLELSNTPVEYDSVNDIWTPAGPAEFYYWKNGLYVGTTAPDWESATPDELDISSPVQG